MAVNSVFIPKAEYGMFYHLKITQLNSLNQPMGSLQYKR